MSLSLSEKIFCAFNKFDLSPGGDSPHDVHRPDLRPQARGRQGGRNLPQDDQELSRRPQVHAPRHVNTGRISPLFRFSRSFHLEICLT